jgi:hypothetical protein
LNYQASWQKKAKELPEEIFSRLEKTPSQSTFPLRRWLPTARSGRDGEGRVLPDPTKRALLVGKNIELLLPDLNRFLNKSEWKLFISQAEGAVPAGRQGCAPGHHSSDIPPDNSITPYNNLVYLKDESITDLTSFPAGIFNLVISLWDLPSQKPDNIPYTDNLYRLLKKKGQFSIITYLDGSPELPLAIIKRIINQKKLPLKIFKSALPDSAGNFRKMLNKIGFGDIRIWKDNIACTYQSAKDLHDDIFSDGEENLFLNSTSAKQRLAIKEEFINEANKSQFPLEISYDFVGGVGVKP